MTSNQGEEGRNHPVRSSLCDTDFWVPSNVNICDIFLMRYSVEMEVVSGTYFFLSGGKDYIFLRKQTDENSDIISALTIRKFYSLMS